MIHYALFFFYEKKACQEKAFRTEIVFEDKNFQFLSSKTTSDRKIPFKGKTQNLGTYISISALSIEIEIHSHF